MREVPLWRQGMWRLERDTDVLASGALGLKGYLDHNKTPPPIGPPQGSRHSPAVGSKGEAFSCESDTPGEL